MWVSRKKWNAMAERNAYLESQLREREIRPGFRKTILYADNEMYLTEICICVSARDWCLLQKEPFFQDLVRYGKELNKQTQ